MSEGAQIYNAVRHRVKQRPYETVRLGEAVEQLMDGQVSPRQAKYGAVVEHWRRILPVELRRHCEITDISGGQLTVRVDSPSYKYELHLCRSEILEELQRQCPKVRLTKIRLM